MTSVQGCILVLAGLWAILMLGFFYGQYKALQAHLPLQKLESAEQSFYLSRQQQPKPYDGQAVYDPAPVVPPSIPVRSGEDVMRFPAAIPSYEGPPQERLQEQVEQDIANQPLLHVEPEPDHQPVNDNNNGDASLITNHADRSKDECVLELLAADKINYQRDYTQKPIWIQDPSWTRSMPGCAVGCNYASKPKQSYTDAIVTNNPASTSNKGYSVLRNMESVTNYPQIDVHKARARGYDIVMNTHLNSDVPVGYFSWVEYGIMEPPQHKTEKAAAAAFISNCGAKSPRLKVLEYFIQHGVPIDSFGKCAHNKEEGGKRDKMGLLRRYRFALAFENSEEEDYVTEKYFQALVAGSVPIVVGAPNIHDYEPSPNSIIHVNSATPDGLAKISNRIKYLMANATAYEEMLAWKRAGPGEKFRALVDMSSTHSACRLCLLVATKQRNKEEARASRKCRCQHEESSVHHIYIRERGQLYFKDVFVTVDDSNPSGNSNLLPQLYQDIYKLYGPDYKPQWFKERKPYSSHEGRPWKIYRVYPADSNQRQALYGNAWFRDSQQLVEYLSTNQCPQLEVVFV